MPLVAGGVDPLPAGACVPVEGAEFVEGVGLAGAAVLGALGCVVAARRFGVVAAGFGAGAGVSVTAPGSGPAGAGTCAGCVAAGPGEVVEPPPGISV